MRQVVVIVFLLVVIAFLSFVMAGCTKGDDKRENNGSFLSEAEPEKEKANYENDIKENERIVPTNEGKKVAQKNEMIAFFQLHQEEMEQFAFHMKAMENQDPEHTYLFAIKENALYLFDGVHIKAQERIAEHPILSEAAFFGHDESLDWVAWSSNWFEREACTFVGEVYDEHGRLYAELFLFYSEEKPVTNDYQAVESLGENWYFYVEYRE